MQDGFHSASEAVRNALESYRSRSDLDAPDDLAQRYLASHLRCELTGKRGFKTIRIHLVNGLPSEILTAEIITWTGKIIVAPRAMLAELAKREEVKRTGVYCLLGPDPETGQAPV